AAAHHALRAVGLLPGHPPAGRTTGRPSPRPAPADLSASGGAPVRPGVPRPAGLGQESLWHRRPAARLPEPAQARAAGHRRGRHAGVQQQPGQGAARGLAQPGAALRREERTPGARLPVPAAGWRLSLPWRRAAAQDADPAAVMRTSPGETPGLCHTCRPHRRAALPMSKTPVRLAYGIGIFLAFYALIGFFILPGAALRIANQQLEQYATAPARLERLEF